VKYQFEAKLELPMYQVYVMLLGIALMLLLTVVFIAMFWSPVNKTDIFLAFLCGVVFYLLHRRLFNERMRILRDLAPREMKFELDEEQCKKIDEWLADHSKTCQLFGPKTAVWMGSPIHYVFTPSGMGDSAVVRCNCGESLDVSDYENF